MKQIGIILLVIVLIGALMFVLNPTTENFNNYLERTDSRNIKAYTAGTRRAAGNVAGETPAPEIKLAEIPFYRYDYYILSVYESKEKSEGEILRYLGMFKTFFKMN